MTTQETILQAVRDWYQSAASLADDQCIVYNEDGPRPDLPYLAVDVALNQLREGELSLAEALGQVTATGWKVALVTVYAYGEEAQAWLESADKKRRTSAILTILNAAGLIVRPAGDGADLDGVLDTSFEPRMAARWDVYYTEVAAAYTAPTLGTSQSWRTMYNAVRAAVEAITGINESPTPFDEDNAPKLAALAGSTRLFYVTADAGLDGSSTGDRQSARVRVRHGVVVHLLVEIAPFGSIGIAYEALLDDERKVQAAIVAGAGCVAYRPLWSGTSRQIGQSKKYLVSQSRFGLVETHNVAVV